MNQSNRFLRTRIRPSLGKNFSILITNIIMAAAVLEPFEHGAQIVEAGGARRGLAQSV
jgi:hypothetical protein